MSAPLPSALRTRFQRYIEEGLSGRAAALRLQLSPATGARWARQVRTMGHPNRHLAGWQGVLQADAYGGYNELYRGDRDPGSVQSALCWSHARRKFFELADIKENARKKKRAHDISPVALEAVKKIDAIFDIERQINGLDASSRLESRRRLVLVRWWRI